MLKFSLQMCIICISRQTMEHQQQWRSNTHTQIHTQTGRHTQTDVNTWLKHSTKQELSYTPEAHSRNFYMKIVQVPCINFWSKFLYKILRNRAVFYLVQETCRRKKLVQEKHVRHASWLVQISRACVRGSVAYSLTSMGLTPTQKYVYYKTLPTQDFDLHLITLLCSDTITHV